MTTLLNQSNEAIINQQATPEGRFFNAAEMPPPAPALALYGRLVLASLGTELAPGEREDVTSAIMRYGEQLVSRICELQKPQLILLGQDSYWTRRDKHNPIPSLRLEGYDTAKDEVILFNYWQNVNDEKTRSAGLEDYVQLLQNVETARTRSLAA